MKEPLVTPGEECHYCILKVIVLVIVVVHRHHIRVGILLAFLLWQLLVL